MIPWAILRSQSKRHVYRFSRFHTGDRRVSLYFNTGTPFPKIVPSRGKSEPHLTHNSLGPPGSAVFAQMTAESSFTMGRPVPPQNYPFPWGIWTPM